MSVWPNFFIIGAAKAGTTSLYYYLNQHPQIFMSTTKEPRFFALEGHGLDFNGPYDEQVRKGTTTTLSDYLALFQDARDEIAAGEASTIYLDHGRAPGAIAQRLPFVEKPRWLLTDLFGFLGVDPHFTPDISTRHNVSGRARSAGLQRWLTGKRPFKDAIKKAIPEQWGHRAISLVQSRNLVRTGLNPDTRRYLIGDYRDDIRRLQELIGRDLSHWLA